MVNDCWCLEISCNKLNSTVHVINNQRTSYGTEDLANVYQNNICMIRQRSLVLGQKTWPICLLLVGLMGCRKGGRRKSCGIMFFKFDNITCNAAILDLNGF